MFGIGFSELIIIGIIALVVIGPEKLPELAAKFGRFVWDIRRAWDDVRDTVRDEMMSVKQPFDEMRQAGLNARETLRREANEFRNSAEKSLRETTAEVREAATGKTKALEPAKQEPAPTADAAPSAAPRATPGLATEPAVSAQASAEAPAEPVAAGPQPYKKPRAVPQGTVYLDLDGNPVEPGFDA